MNYSSSKITKQKNELKTKLAGYEEKILSLKRNNENCLILTGSFEIQNISEKIVELIIREYKETTATSFLLIKRKKYIIVKTEKINTDNFIVPQNSKIAIQDSKFSLENRNGQLEKFLLDNTERREKIFAQFQTLIFNKKEELPIELPVSAYTNSLCILPFEVWSNLVGILFIEFSCENGADKLNVENLKFFANLSALSIRNSRLFNHIFYRMKELEGFLEVAKKLSAATDINSILEICVETAISEMSNISNCFMSIYTKTGKVISFKEYGKDFNKVKKLNNIFTSENKLVKNISLEAEPFIFFNINSSPLLREIDYPVEEKSKSLGIFPFYADTDTFGILAIECSEENEITDNDSILIKKLLEHASICIGNCIKQKGKE